eukprot:7688381-Alexandrium_andersonii.AAC.1
MSASLVGSEMCIRDSRRPSGPCSALFGALSRRLKAPNSADTAQRGAEPVSYTHLTLPTICSV